MLVEPPKCLHCLQAALACGITGEEIRELVAEAEKVHALGQGGWYPSVMTPQRAGSN